MLKSNNSERKRSRDDEERKLNVLISAFACWPGRGSEQGVGWNWATLAAEFHNVWVLAYPENRSAVETELDRMSGPKPSFVYWTVPGWPMSLLPIDEYMRIYYVLWQITVLPLAFWLHWRIRFDAVHHLTFNTIELPGLLWLIGAPFYWGPVGGAQEPPKALRGHFGKAWVGELVRIARKRFVPYNPIVRASIRKARRVLAANADTAKLLRRSGATNLLHEIETGIDLTGIDVVHSTNTRPHLTILWAGKFFARKGPLLALSIIARAKDCGIPVQLLIAGDGPMETAMREEISRSGLDDEVSIVGRLSLAEMRAFYRSGDVLLFTSLHDTSGNVIIEAMAHGLPVLALDHHGASEIVDHASGIKVPVTDEARIIDAFADALGDLHRDPDARREMGLAARKRVETMYTWEQKRRLIRDLYDTE